MPSSGATGPRGDPEIQSNRKRWAKGEGRDAAPRLGWSNQIPLEQTCSTLLPETFSEVRII